MEEKEFQALYPRGDQPAHPYIPPRPWDDISAGGFSGMTIREEIASRAMQGLRAGKLIRSQSYMNSPAEIWTSAQIAKQAVADADALLEELAKKK